MEKNDWLMLLVFMFALVGGKLGWEISNGDDALDRGWKTFLGFILAFGFSGGVIEKFADHDYYSGTVYDDPIGPDDACDVNRYC